MKLQLFVVIFLGFAATTYSQTADEKAILKIAKAESESFFKRDSAVWLSYRVQSKDASITFVSSYGYNYMKGWDSISKVYYQSFRRSNVKFANVQITEPLIKVNGDLAFAEYNQVATVTTADTTMNTPTIEMRVFNKVNGKWKVFSQVTTFPSAIPLNTDAAVEDDLNTTGYKLLSAKKIDDAIEVFKLNVKMHPNSWNPYDSLGEAYAIAGKNALAIENYETSIKLNPKNENGITVLKKLSKQ